jgi:hypothetical protein
MMKKARVILAKIFFFLVLLFVLAEAGVRIYLAVTKQNIDYFRPSFYFEGNFVVDRSRFKSHPFMPFAPIANDKRVIHLFKPKLGKMITQDYVNNSLGFRTPERPYAKPSQTKRVVTVGGSTTWDGPTNETTWPALLEKKLNEYYLDKNFQVEVINLSVEAGISPMSLNILEMFGVHFEPDLVISYDGVNDVWPGEFWTGVIPDYSNYITPFNDKILSFRKMLPKVAFKSYALTYLSWNLDRIYNLEFYLPTQVWKGSAANTDKTLGNAMPLYFKNLRLMRGVCLEYSCNFVASVPHWAEPDQYSNEFASESRNFFAQAHLNYLDLEKMLPYNDYTIHTDDVHWTEKGTNMVAEIWFKKIVDENLLFPPVASGSASH